MKKIAIIVTLDTKAAEAAYLRERIESHGHETLVVDISTGAEPAAHADITAAQVARSAGTDIGLLRASQDRESVGETMIAGTVAELRGMWENDELEAVISLGGASGGILAAGIMSEVPYRIPKLIFSSGASIAGSHRWFGPTGVTVMHCLVDVEGLNRLLKEQLARAAGAICGMAEAQSAVGMLVGDGERPRIAMSTNNWVENSAAVITRALSDEYEVIHFHASGTSEVFMEKLIEEDYFKAVIDLVPSSITNHVFGGSRPSWSRRLEVAGEKSLPQVVAPCLVNVISRFRDSPEAIDDLKFRKHYFIDRQRVLLWLTAGEVRDIAPVYSDKLNKALGPTKFLVPLKGWSRVETEGSEFHDPEAVEGFVAKIKEGLRPAIEVREVDANIDSDAFAAAAIAAFREVVQA